MKPGPERRRVQRRGFVLTLIGSAIFGVMWIPTFANTPGDTWISTIGVLVWLVGVGHFIQADMFKD